MTDETVVDTTSEPETTTDVSDPAQVKPSWIWLKDSRGYGSVTVTLVAVAFWVTTFAYVLSIVEKIGPVSIRPFDIGACGAYFTPILVLYFGRKYTDAKMISDASKK